jgi:hypothetical protein
MVVEGESVRAFVEQPAPGATFVRLRAEKADGTPVLQGTASVGDASAHPHELRQRIAKLRPATGLVINRDLKVGQRGAVVEKIRMGFDQHMGDHYPFTLNDKLKVITEPCDWYTPEGGKRSPWGRAIIPTEMVSVLLGATIAEASSAGASRPWGSSPGRRSRW